MLERLRVRPRRTGGHDAVRTRGVCGLRGRSIGRNATDLSVCGSLLRPHVLWFDEIYASHLGYQFAEVQGWLADCDLVVFVGTSFSVGITDMALDAAIGRRVPHLNVNPTGNDNMGNWIQGAAEHVLPAVVDGWSTP